MVGNLVGGLKEGSVVLGDPHPRCRLVGVGEWKNQGILVTVGV